MPATATKNAVAKRAVKTADATTNKKSSRSTKGKFTKSADGSLSELFVSGLKETLWAENHLVKSLPKMIAAAADAALGEVLRDHRELTKKHAGRLEKALELLGEKPLAQKCDAMEGLVMSGEAVIENTPAGSAARDTGIMMSALKVENFEITTYNGLVQLANDLGKPDIAELLQQNLADEQEASDMLTDMAQP